VTSRAAAAAFAEDVRRERSQVLVAVSSGALPLRDLLKPGGADRIKVVAVAEVAPGVGKVGARRVLDRLGIAGASRWGELARQDAEALVTALEQSAPGSGA
jgi:hypothetical protein